MNERWKFWSGLSWSGRRNRVQSRQGVEAELAIEQCDRFLAGHMLDQIDAAGGEYPHWVWLNTLGHASEAELEQLARGMPAIDDTAEVRRARAMLRVLARDVLECARASTATVAELQRTVVIPIELRTLTAPVAPVTLVRLVRSGLAAAKKQPAT